MANLLFKPEMPKDNISGRHKRAIDPSNVTLYPKNKDTLFCPTYKIDKKMPLLFWIGGQMDANGLWLFRVFTRFCLQGSQGLNHKMAIELYFLQLSKLKKIKCL